MIFRQIGYISLEPSHEVHKTRRRLRELDFKKWWLVEGAIGFQGGDQNYLPKLRLQPYHMYTVYIRFFLYVYVYLYAENPEMRIYTYRYSIY